MVKDSFDEFRLKEESMLNNKTRRALISVCIDNSKSMSGIRIDTVNTKINEFIKNMYSNKMARASVELSIITFGHEVSVIREFLPLSSKEKLNIVANGSRTEMGEGVKKALDLLDNRMEELTELGTRFYKPWLIIISDGEASDINKCIEVSKKVIDRQKAGELKVKCMNFSTEGEIDSLKQFSVDESVDMVDDMKTWEFFSMLSRSISSVSQARFQVGEF